MTLSSRRFISPAISSIAGLSTIFSIVVGSNAETPVPEHRWC
jgi:hypothetical protein